MKRKDEIELRRSVRGELMARKRRRYAVSDDESRWRMCSAIYHASKDGSLSEEAVAFLMASRNSLEEAAHRRIQAESDYDKRLLSLALLLGVRA
jgi:hypothetical protein